MFIREKIFKILFPDFYEDYNYLRHVGGREKIVFKDKYNDVFETIERDKVEVIDIRKNKKDEWVIVTKWVTDNDVWIKLYSPTYLACNRHPRIMSSIINDYINEKKYIKIDDVLMEDDNIGNGTICMENFIKEIKNIGCDYIKGELSSVDKDHFDRSIHYYKKFGFEVRLNEEKTCGSIKLSLK